MQLVASDSNGHDLEVMLAGGRTQELVIRGQFRRRPPRRLARSARPELQTGRPAAVPLPQGCLAPRGHPPAAPHRTTDAPPLGGDLRTTRVRLIANPGAAVSISISALVSKRCSSNAYSITQNLCSVRFLVLVECPRSSVHTTEKVLHEATLAVPVAAFVSLARPGQRQEDFSMDGKLLIIAEPSESLPAACGCAVPEPEPS